MGKRYEDYLDNGTKRIDEFCSSNGVSNSERQLIVNDFTDELLNHIGNTDDLNDYELIIHSASLRYVDGEISRLLSRKFRYSSERDSIISLCERQLKTISVFNSKKWPLPKIKNTNPLKIKEEQEREEKAIQEERERIAREEKARAERERKIQEEKERKDQEERERLAQERKALAERERLRKEEQARKEAELRQREKERRKKRTRLIILSSLSAAIIIAFVLLYVIVLSPMIKYTDAQKLEKDGKLAEAAILYQSLGTYQDSKEKYEELGLVLAQQYELERKFAEARDVYLSLGLNADAKIMEIKFEKEQKYQKAKKLMDESKYHEAADMFFEIEDYDNSRELALENRYLEAQTLFNNGEYVQAITVFETIKEYNDSASRIIQAQASQIYDTGDIAQAYDIYTTIDEKYNQHSKDYEDLYNKAAQLRTEGRLEDTATIYRSLGAYKDSKENYKEVALQLIQQYEQEKEYGKAREVYLNLGMEAEAEAAGIKQEKEQKYREAKKLMEEHRYHAAAAMFLEIEDYEDSLELAHESKYLAAIDLLDEGKYDQAISIFETIQDYKDSASRITQAQANQLYDTGNLAKAYEVYSTIDESYNQHIDEYQNLYDTADQKYVEGQLQEAFDTFLKLGSFKESSNKSKMIGEQLISQYEAERKYSAASNIYQGLGMETEAQQATKNQEIEDLYQQAIALMNSADYLAAKNAFETLGDYEDSNALKTECDYLSGKALMEEGYYTGAADCFRQLGDYKDSQALVSENMYLYANELTANGELQDAAEIYSQLGDYQDSSTKHRELQYIIADNHIQNDEFDAAIDVFASLGEVEKIKETKYKHAEALFAKGYIKDAYSKLMELGDYQNANQRAEEMRQAYIKQMKADMAFEVGNTIIFGEYEQDGITVNGPEPLEWVIIWENDDAIFVTTKYAIDCFRYHDPREIITWEHSNIRNWLNNDFYNHAFSAEEREAIRKTAVSNTKKDGKHDTDPGKNTYDYIYLLSYYEAYNYFKSDEERKLVPTEVARQKGAHYLNCYWMTRSPGTAPDQIMAVKDNGQTDYSTAVTDDHLGIRPAMWLNLEGTAIQKAMLAKGSVVSFGGAPNENHVYIPIHWRVIDKDDNAVVLLAEEAVDNLQFHDKNYNVTWGNSKLRKIMNNTFPIAVFNENEINSLLTMDVKLDSGDGVKGYRGTNSTVVQDKVTLLSYKQAVDIFGDKEQRRRRATEYARKQGAGNGFTEYWLLSMGKNDNTMAIINGNGDPDSRSVTDKKGVLPMIKVSLSFGFDGKADESAPE